MTPEFTQIASYPYSVEAHLNRARLEDAGIEAFLRDDITIDSDPLMSQAIGGVKLMVRTPDGGRALEILGDVEPFSTAEDGSHITCPKCGSDSVEMVTSVDSVASAIKFALVSLAGLFPILRHKYRCNGCGQLFALPANTKSLLL